MNTKKLERIAFIEYKNGKKYKYYVDECGEIVKRGDGASNPDWYIDVLSEDLMTYKAKKIRYIQPDIIESILEYFDPKNKIEQYNGVLLKIKLLENQLKSVKAQLMEV